MRKWLIGEVTPPPDEVGRWMTIGLYVIGGVYLVLKAWQLLFPRQPDYVTPAQLEDAVQKLERTISGLVGRPEYELQKVELNKRFEALESYLHQRMHDLRDGQQAVVFKLDTVALLVQREIGRREGQAEQP